MALPERAQNVLRSLRSGFPSGVVLGRRSANRGPAEFIPISEMMAAQLDAIFPSAAQGAIIYKNATSWVALTAGSAGHVLTTNGAGANPSWEAPSGGGSAWWFSPPTLPALATAVTDGTVTGLTTADDNDAGMQLRAATIPASDNSYLRLESAPTAPFDVVVRVRLAARSSGHYSIAGAALRESSSGRKVVFGTMSSNRYAGRRATGTASGSDILLGGEGTTNVVTDNNCWFRIACDASYNLTLYVSPDGKQWEQVSSVTAATGGWSSLDQAGVGIYCRANSGQPIMATFEHYTAA